MFFCTFCGHADYAHTSWAGACIHGAMKPKDDLPCFCPRMDYKGDVHNHGPEGDAGLACNELRAGERRIGTCLSSVAP